MKIHTRRMSPWRVACKVASIIVPIAIAGVLLAFLAFAAITSPGCSARPEPKPFPPADWRLEGMAPGVVYYTKPDGTLVGCAQGPEVVP